MLRFCSSKNLPHLHNHRNEWSRKWMTKIFFLLLMLKQVNGWSNCNILMNVSINRFIFCRKFRINLELKSFLTIKVKNHLNKRVWFNLEQLERDYKNLIISVNKRIMICTYKSLKKCSTQTVWGMLLLLVLIPVILCIEKDHDSIKSAREQAERQTKPTSKRLIK